MGIEGSGEHLGSLALWLVGEVIVKPGKGGKDRDVLTQSFEEPLLGMVET